MDNCFVACGCDDYEGITKSDLDRFTDKIENVLNDERGRKLFRNFMHTSKLHAGRRALAVWENIERLLNYTENAESGSRSHSNYLDDVYLLLDKAERIEEIDFTTMERLTTALAADNKEGINEGLQLLKVEATKAMRREYSAFRDRFLPK
ncbi:hypothetical protein PYW07_016948 [Mythimna separata]|uniref:RGS domain-containing protein n=1 Tax=Mythimna separata TaxID=271217 RepID=A0AAD7YVQ4_MYTSE|nr:hypothetical protein PYW07_016948 [Mythimna separata]